MAIFIYPPDATFEVVMENTNWQPIFSPLGLSRSKRYGLISEDYHLEFR